MRSLALVLLSALSFAPLQTTAPQLSAKATVEAFASLDAAGARLESGPNDPIWKLTADDGEAPVAPVVLIESFKVAEQAGKDKTAIISARYQVKGTVKDNGGPVSFVPGRRTEQTTFLLARGDDGTWKISEAKLRISPHVTTVAYVQHLDKLLALYDASKEGTDPRYRSLLRLRKALQPQATAKN